jgi:hypothetical protein
MACDSATTTGLVAVEGFNTLDEPDFMKGIRE